MPTTRKRWGQRFLRVSWPTQALAMPPKTWELAGIANLLNGFETTFSGWEKAAERSDA